MIASQFCWLSSAIWPPQWWSGKGQSRWWDPGVCSPDGGWGWVWGIQLSLYLWSNNSAGTLPIPFEKAQQSFLPADIPQALSEPGTETHPLDINEWPYCLPDFLILACAKAAWGCICALAQATGPQVSQARHCHGWQQVPLFLWWVQVVSGTDKLSRL